MEGGHPDSIISYKVMQSSKYCKEGSKIVWRDIFEGFTFDGHGLNPMLYIYIYI